VNRQQTAKLHPLVKNNNTNRSSKDKLPEISLSQKHHMFETRCDKIVLSKIPKCDQVNLRNMYECNEYAEDIHTYMKSIEAATVPKASYMKGQTDINESMRAILVDWLVDVHLKFKLLSETLFLTVNLIDRYLSLKQIPRTKLQLVGVSAMLITTKYEEIYPPTVKDFVYITDNAYSREEVLDMESDILQTLDFDLQQTSCYRFLERYAKVMRADSVAFNLA